MNIIGYIHVCQIGDWRSIFSNLMNVIKTSNLYNFTSIIRVCIVNHANMLIPDEIINDPKLEIHYLGNCEQFERPTLLHMKKYAELDMKNTVYYYLHTKGVKYNELDEKKQNIQDWINLMLYFNIEKWELAIEKLVLFNTYGCNHIENIHYSGNFWWANQSYIKNLPGEIESHYIAPEDWVCKLNKRHFSIFNSGLEGFGHYNNRYNRENYVNNHLIKDNYCIITNNCFGYKYYKKKNIPYNTPFIGLFLFAPCYIKLLENFEYYMNIVPVKKNISKYNDNIHYPVGQLDDIEIHFLHYDSIENAIIKWENRKKRMKNKNDCIVKMCDRDLFDASIGERFLHLNFKNKILFISNKYKYLLPLSDKNTNITVLPDNFSESPNGDTLEMMYPFYKFITNNTSIFGVYFICCKNNYFEVVKEQIMEIMNSGLYEETNKLIIFITLINENNNEMVDFLNNIDRQKKFILIKTSENLYEKFAINNYKKYLPENSNYYLYYFHTKGVTNLETLYQKRRKILNFFTLNKYKISLLLLEKDSVDAVGCSLSKYPKLHFSGNFWWSKKSYLDSLPSEIGNHYLEPEMYIGLNNNAKMTSLDNKTNILSSDEIDNLYLQGKNAVEMINTFPIENFTNLTEQNILDNITTVPIDNKRDEIYNY